MFDLKKLCAEDRRFEETELEPFGKFKARLITPDELKDLMSKSQAEFIFYCVYDMEGKKAFPDVNSITANVLFTDAEAIFDKILKVNHVVSSPEEVKEK